MKFILVSLNQSVHKSDEFLLDEQTVCSNNSSMSNLYFHIFHANISYISMA